MSIHDIRIKKDEKDVVYATGYFKSIDEADKFIVKCLEKRIEDWEGNKLKAVKVEKDKPGEEIKKQIQKLKE